MALLSGMMRTVAVTGRTDHIHRWVADRQAGAWAERTMRSGLPRPAPSGPAVATPQPADPAETLRQLTQLHESGVINDAEYDGLRARAGA